MADWRHARASATSLGHRVLVDAQGVVSVIRVFAMVTTAQLGQRDVWGPFAWAFAVAVVLSLAPMFSFLLRSPASTEEVVWLTLLLAPAAIAALYPPITVLVVVLTGWVVPVANEAFRIEALEILAGPRSAGSPQLPAGPVAPSLQVLKVLSVALAAPTFLVLGFAIRRRWMQGDSWRVAQFAAGSAAVVAIVGGQALAALMPGSPSGTAQWLILVIAWTITAIAFRGKTAITP